MQKLSYAHSSLLSSLLISNLCSPLANAHMGWYATEHFEKAHWMHAPTCLFPHTSHFSPYLSGSMSSITSGSIARTSLTNASGSQLAQKTCAHRPPPAGFSAPPGRSHRAHFFASFPFRVAFEPFSHARQNHSPSGTRPTP